MVKTLKGKAVAAALVAVSFVGTASAGVESEAAMDSLLAEGNALLAKAWPIAVAITVGVIGIKLFKKFARTSTN